LKSKIPIAPFLLIHLFNVYLKLVLMRFYDLFLLVGMSRGIVRFFDK
jgi:hypothetical protein